MNLVRQGDALEREILHTPEFFRVSDDPFDRSLLPRMDINQSI